MALINELNMTKLIGSVKIPTDNIKFELDSADGYAFLGYARKKVGLSHIEYLKAAKIRNFTLNHEYTIKGTIVPKNGIYTYTSWVCLEFAIKSGNKLLARKLLNRVDNIGKYSNGMIRYCNTETKYVVPNVTSAAALMYCMNGQSSKAKPLVNTLRRMQSRGNWNYHMFNNSKNKYQRLETKEDNMHLAMMVYHLKEINKLSGIETSDMIAPAMEILKKNNKKINEKRTKIGWDIPFVALASHGLDNNLYGRAIQTTINKSLVHKNFRTRAISAWVISKTLVP